MTEVVRFHTVSGRHIRIRGAGTHNLKKIDVDIPLGRLVVLSGVSGSGKSSLAFDTIFAEGQRRFLESLSIRSRSFVKQLQAADVDEVTGLPPSVCVTQRVTAASARSTLAVTAEIYDYLQLLYSRAGTAHCTGCGKPVISRTVGQIVSETLRLPERSRLMVLAPLVKSRRGRHQEVMERLRSSGYVRARIDGELLDVTELPTLAATKAHSIDIVIDRIVVKEGIEQRLRESIQLACRESEGTCLICRQQDEGWEEKRYSIRYSCADCDLQFVNPDPRVFSFQSVTGACTVCQGTGIQGTAETDGTFVDFGVAACPACGGSRLNPFASRVKFLGKTIGEFTGLTISDAAVQIRQWIHDVASDTTLQRESVLVAEKVLPEILLRLQCLEKTGIGYLTLNRSSRSLSGGEYQRARLAGCLGSGLHGTCIILDEPTAGLHPRDTGHLIATLKDLRDRGSSVIVVEHDSEVIRSADWLVDLGPGAGVDGGRVLYSGPPNEISGIADSVTGSWFRGELLLKPEPSEPNASSVRLGEAEGSSFLTIKNARRNNLQNVTLGIPLNRLVCVTGVSGSGKSSLIMETLLPLARRWCLEEPRPVSVSEQSLRDADCDGIVGLQQINRVVALNSEPLGRNARSCIATISGLWNEVRVLFSKTRLARTRGWGSHRFSFNSGTGRCPECRGTGIRNLRMKFLPDASVPCAACGGLRFQASTLSVRFQDRSVADVLAMRVDEAHQFFSGFSRIQQILSTLIEIGLGYLKIGQPSTTFSGGESQRVRLALELTESQSGNTLYVLDEPTSGLHPADIRTLMLVIRRLVQNGHSVVVIEHNPQVMLNADWLIDVGPESGPGGGQIVFSGTPKVMLRNGSGHTATAMKAEMEYFQNQH